MKAWLIPPILALEYLALTIAGWPALRYVHQDFIGFWAAGRILLAGGNPYDPAQFKAMHDLVGSTGLEIVPSGWGFGYPLATAIATLPFAVLPVPFSAPLWLLSQLVVALGAVGLLTRTVAPSANWPAKVLLFFILISHPVQILAQDGDMGGFLLASVAGGVTLVLRGHHLAGGALLGLLVVKPHPFLWFIPILMATLIVRRPPDAVRLAIGGMTTTASLLAASFAFRPNWVNEWLATVGGIQALNRPRPNAWGLIGPNLDWLAWTLVALVVLCLVVWWRRWKPTTAMIVAAALPISLLGAPYGWAYDQIILFASAAIVAASAASAPKMVRRTVVAGIFVILVVVPHVLYVIAFPPSLAEFLDGHEGLSSITPLLAFIGVLGADRLLLDHTKNALPQAAPGPAWHSRIRRGSSAEGQRRPSHRGSD